MKILWINWKAKKKKPIVANRDTINYGYFDG